MLSHLCAIRLAIPASILILTLGVGGFSQEPAALPPVQVTIQDEKPVTAEVVMPVDPTQHVMLIGQPNMMLNLRVDNQNLHLGSIQTVFKIDGQVMYPGNPPGRMVVSNRPLDRKKDGKARTGSMSVYEIHKVTLTQEIEVVPTKGKPGEKRRLDAAVVRYTVDNKDDKPHNVGIRVQMYTFLVNNRGSLFAAPNQPGKILDGVELKGAKVPDYVQVLQRPNLKDPGYVAHITCNLGTAFERPERVVLTRLLQFQPNQWDIQIAPAQGISAVAVYWDPRDVKPHTQRKAAYAYGQGLASRHDGDGDLSIQLGGSFEPGKLFTIAAQVMDPAQGQSLQLELPPGMERVEGSERQAVPAIDDDGNTMVLWKARVLKTGRYNLRIRSSTGTTQTKIITITRPGEKTAGS
jgi:hypothetical protein